MGGSTFGRCNCGGGGGGGVLSLLADSTSAGGGGGGVHFWPIQPMIQPMCVCLGGGGGGAIHFRPIQSVWGRVLSTFG